MSVPYDKLILGDWGTSACRLYLCDWVDSTLTVVDRTQGPGIKHVDDAETTFFNLCQSWFDSLGHIPTFLIGTVGADIGWRQAPYVACPTNQDSLLTNAVTFKARGIDFTIIPGLSCTNRHGLPDIMRGEETQIVGYLSQLKTLPAEQLVCLPGTHAKWALLQQDTIASFVTSPVGELFEVLSAQSVLLQPKGLDEWSQTDFQLGVSVGLSSTSNLLHTLFATRAKQVLLGDTNTQAASYLSGLLVGADVKAAMQDFHLFSKVTLIGSERINQLYEQALGTLGVSTEKYSSEWATLHGLHALASERWREHA